MATTQLLDNPLFIPFNHSERSAVTSGSVYRTSIIIPVYNEEGGLPLVLEALGKVVDSNYEIIVVDDGSSDGSVAVAQQFPCHVYSHSINQGKGAAMRTGLSHARGQNVIFVDADNTYPVDRIPAIVSLLEEYDFVRGIRSLGRDHIPLVNRLGNFLFDFTFRILHSIKDGDVLSGLYGVRREALTKMNLVSNGFDVETEIVTKIMAHGFSYTTLPISYNERVGEKKLKVVRDGARILERVLFFAVVYNPVVALVIPGLLLTFFALLSLFAVLSGLWMQFDIPLSRNATFLFGFLTLVGIQIMIFGLAVYEAGHAFLLHGHKSRVLEVIRGRMRVWPTAMAGAATSFISFLVVMALSFNWWGNGFGEFNHTFALVIASLLGVIGIQTVSAAVFLSALRKLQQVSS